MHITFIRCKTLKHNMHIYMLIKQLYILLFHGYLWNDHTYGGPMKLLICRSPLQNIFTFHPDSIASSTFFHPTGKHCFSYSPSLHTMFIATQQLFWVFPIMFSGFPYISVNLWYWDQWHAYKALHFIFHLSLDHVTLVAR